MGEFQSFSTVSVLKIYVYIKQFCIAHMIGCKDKPIKFSDVCVCVCVCARARVRAWCM